LTQLKYYDLSILNIQQISHFEFIHLNQTISSQTQTFEVYSNNTQIPYIKSIIVIVLPLHQIIYPKVL